LIDFPFLISVKVLLQEIEAEKKDKGVINLADHGNEIRQDVHGNKEIHNAGDKHQNGPPRHVAIVPFEIVFYEPTEELHVLYESVQQTDFNKAVFFHPSSLTTS
jgi:hypothetical protein